MGSGRRAAIDIVVQLIGRVANLLLGVVVIGLLTRKLGTAGFGEWSAIFAICQIAGYVGQLGLEPATVRRSAAEPDESPALLGALLVLRVLLAVPAAVLSIVTVILIAESDTMVHAGYLAAAATVLGAPAALRVAFQLRVRNDVPVAVDTVNSLLWTGAVIVLAATGAHGLVAFAAAFLASQTVSTALLAGLALRATPLRVRFADLRRHAGGLLRVGAVMGLGQLLNFAYARVDQVLVLRFNGEEQAGLYGAAYQLLDRAQFLPITVLTTLLPLLAAAFVTDRRRLQRLVSRGFEFLMLVSLPVLAFSLVASEPLIAALFGDAFRPAAAALPILMGTFVLMAVGYLLGCLALVIGTESRLMGIAAIGLVFNVVVNVALLPGHTYLVAAWTTLATEVLVGALVVPITLGRLRMGVQLARIPWIALASTFMGVAVWALRAAGLEIVWLLILAIPIYGLAALMLRAVDVAGVRQILTKS